jgi:hypothetical protein
MYRNRANPHSPNRRNRMTNHVAIMMPNGYFANGAPWREAHLRELTGEDQVFLMEECHGLLPAQWVTEALSRCVTRLGPNQPTREAIRSLSVGDREALLLHLRRLTSGDHLDCVISCPSPDCREKLDIELNVANLLVSTDGETRQEHELGIHREDGSPVVVRFRLPTGSDQEAVAHLARTDVGAAAEEMLRRCVQSVNEDGAAVSELPAALREQLPGRMAELDAQAEINLLVECSVCGGAFSVVFDTAGYLIQELEAGMRRLYREVHLLAYHYHWSAREILSMSVRKRRRFLQLLEEELMQEAVQ